MAAQLDGATHLRIVLGEVGGMGTGCTGINPYDEPTLRGLVDPANETDRLSVFPIRETLDGEET